MNLVLMSSAFSQGEPIPAKYTQDGEDVSPPLSWQGTPADTRSLALVCEDPDAPMGTWTHWLLYGMAGEQTRLPENVPAAERLSDGARQGLNDFRGVGYGGPAPPPGKPHRYFFKLYALDAAIQLAPRATRRELLQAMEGHVLATGQMMGTYQR